LCAAQVACVQPSAHAGSKRAFTMRVLPRRCLTTSSLLSSTSAALFGLSSPRRLPPLPPWCWAAPATAAPTCGKRPVCLCARVIRSIDSSTTTSHVAPPRMPSSLPCLLLATVLTSLPEELELLRAHAGTFSVFGLDVRLVRVRLLVLALPLHEVAGLRGHAVVVIIGTA